MGKKAKKKGRLFFLPTPIFSPFTPNVEPGTKLKGRLKCTVGASSIDYQLSASCCSRNLYRSKRDP